MKKTSFLISAFLSMLIVCSCSNETPSSSISTSVPNSTSTLPVESSTINIESDINSTLSLLDGYYNGLIEDYDYSTDSLATLKYRYELCKGKITNAKTLVELHSALTEAMEMLGSVSRIEISEEELKTLVAEYKTKLTNQYIIMSNFGYSADNLKELERIFQDGVQQLESFNKKSQFETHFNFVVSELEKVETLADEAKVLEEYIAIKTQEIKDYANKLTKENYYSEDSILEIKSITNNCLLSFANSTTTIMVDTLYNDTISSLDSVAKLTKEEYEEIEKLSKTIIEAKTKIDLEVEKLLSSNDYYDLGSEVKRIANNYIDFISSETNISQIEAYVEQAIKEMNEIEVYVMPLDEKIQNTTMLLDQAYQQLIANRVYFEKTIIEKYFNHYLGLILASNSKEEVEANYKDGLQKIKSASYLSTEVTFDPSLILEDYHNYKNDTYSIKDPEYVIEEKIIASKKYILVNSNVNIYVTANYLFDLEIALLNENEVDVIAVNIYSIDGSLVASKDILANQSTSLKFDNLDAGNYYIGFDGNVNINKIKVSEQNLNLVTFYTFTFEKLEMLKDIYSTEENKTEVENIIQTYYNKAMEIKNKEQAEVCYLECLAKLEELVNA